MGTRTMHNGISYDGYTGMYSDINAAAVSPRDKKAYAVMKGVVGGSSAEASYLVRFDSNTVHFVAPTKSWTWMACTDSSGDYLYVQGGVSVSGSNGAIAGPLYKIGTPDALTGYRSVTGLNNAGVTDSTSILIDTSEAGVSGWQAGGNGVADIAAVHVDLLGAGSKQRYVVGITHTGKVLMIRYTAPVKTYRLGTGSNPGSSFGSCWTYKDATSSEHVYCARNDGGGIYEVMLGSVNLVTQTVSLAKLGVGSASTGYNDAPRRPVLAAEAHAKMA